MVDCPICGKSVSEAKINSHLDSDCDDFIETSPPPIQTVQSGKSPQVASFFRTPSSKKSFTPAATNKPEKLESSSSTTHAIQPTPAVATPVSNKRAAPQETTHDKALEPAPELGPGHDDEPSAKRFKPTTALQRAAPLAERVRPRTLDHVYGQELVGPDGVLRGLIEADRVPSMILWGGAGTGKTTIARVIANMVNSRFIEINSTSSGVAECKKIFSEAKAELGLTGRKTIIFCDEIHRFSKSQQDVFLGPVESGQVTLIGATTENPSFKVQNALLSRCRTFTLQQLANEDITIILQRALQTEGADYSPSALVDNGLLKYLAEFSEGDARTALNLLELAMNLSTRPSATQESIKSALTKTLVYDRAGDQHYDAISALHKSIRGSSPSASLYYLGRMLASGESALYIARRLIVIASEDVGLADSTLLPLCTAAHDAVEKVGLPEARINLAHAVTALALAPKSTRVYRALATVERALQQQPGTASLPIPMHLRNAPSRLMRDLGFGKGYKYPPQYRDGKCVQDYLPDALKGLEFLDEQDLGTEVDPDLEDHQEQ
ncbi:hypothetical protein MMC07_003356 [Pseudocyphellaria aurata]|nr:hypothetical protein [Pseudocyphellaria aurata]